MRAPQGAVAWTPEDGFLYRNDPVPVALEAGDLVLVVSDDGELRGVTPHDRAPLAAMLRVDGDLADVVTRLDEIADELAVLERQAGARLTAAVHRLSTLEELHARLAERVSDLGDRAEGLDTGLATEVAALKHRVRTLEGSERP